VGDEWFPTVLLSKFDSLDGFADCADLVELYQYGVDGIFGFSFLILSILVTVRSSPTVVIF
jgi:hypothetical protein